MFQIEKTDSVRWVSNAWFRMGLTGGRAELVGLPPGRYLIRLNGIYAERPLADWQPPPGHPTEVIVGEDPWKRPVQARGYEAWEEWTIKYGNCADSIVVRLRPKHDWVTRTGEKRIDTRKPVLPPPYGWTK